LPCLAANFGSPPGAVRFARCLRNRSWSVLGCSGAQSSAETGLTIHSSRPPLRGGGLTQALGATGKIMERLVFLLAMATIAACSAASEPQSPPLSCVPDDSCGCRILISGASCPDGGAHLFHELADGAPLQINFGQGPVMATSPQARTNLFSPEPGSSWTETYRYDGGGIEIRYSPGASTCSKFAQGEQCEYFDIRARVLISRPQGTQNYSGVGTCGC
jgi:hypothetical protein